MARDHHLRRVVVIGDFADLAFGGRFGQRGGLLDIRAEQRGHRADADGHRILHGDAAQAQQLGGVGQRECPGGAQRTVFAERMTRDAIGALGESDPEFLFEDSGSGHRIGHDRGLGVGGHGQLAFRPVLHQRRELLLERLVNLFEHRTGMRAGVGEVGAHADFLASLTGKDECSHVILLAAAPSRARRAPQARRGQSCWQHRGRYPPCRDRKCRCAGTSPARSRPRRCRRGGRSRGYR